MSDYGTERLREVFDQEMSLQGSWVLFWSCKSNRANTVFECGEVLENLGEGAGVINNVVTKFNFDLNDPDT